MAARRDGVPGKRTPTGILTHLKDTPLGIILEEIENRSEVAAVEVGLELLKLSSKGADDVNLAIKKIISAASDGKQHDFTVAISGESGLTIHCNTLPNEMSQDPNCAVIAN